MTSSTTETRVLVIVDQLRRAAPGGIGTYARGLSTRACPNETRQDNRARVGSTSSCGPAGRAPGRTPWLHWADRCGRQCSRGRC